MRGVGKARAPLMCYRGPLVRKTMRRKIMRWMRMKRRSNDVLQLSRFVEMGGRDIIKRIYKSD